MNDMFEFNEKTHTYTLDGKRMTGCTTVLGVIAKPALIGWAAKMASGYVKDNLKDMADLNRVCEEAKTAHNKKRDKAADLGTDIHEEIEGLINDAININKGFFFEKLQHKEKQVQHFITWAVKNKVKFLESEKRVYSKKHFVAGTYDFKCEIDGKIYIGDIKTSSGIYDRTPFAQTAAYQMMEKEMCEDLMESCPQHKGVMTNFSKECTCGIQEVNGRLIINLKKTGIFDEDKDVYVSEHYEDDLELFMSALSIYRIMKNRFEPINKFIK